jgi:hypothetical protein
VKAESFLREKSIKDDLLTVRAPIEEVLGTDSEKRIRGLSHSKTRLNEYEEVDFANGTIFALYELVDGERQLTTMYADPKLNLKGNFNE